jgi:hypothetical protein
MAFRILHIIIAINIFISTTGIHIFEHSCSKKGSKFGFYIKPGSCCSSKKMTCHLLKIIKTAEPKKSASELSRKPCCQNLFHFEKNELLGTKQLASDSSKSFQLPHVFFFYPTFFAHVFHFSIIKNNWKALVPPLLFSSIYKLLLNIRC